VAGSCESVNGHSGSIKGGEFFVWLSDYSFLKKDSALSSLGHNYSTDTVHRK
jgi:hypothetical protein